VEVGLKICDDLTNPEDSAEREKRRRILAELKAHGGCAYCVHRDLTSVAWGRYLCEAGFRRMFPNCTTDGKSPAFELDENKLKDRLL
jgi:hypothetical protein